ncbi:MAG: DciA family protein [Egibacteraceae bacterium]
MTRRFDPLGEATEAGASTGDAPTEIGELLAAVTRTRGWSERLEGARVHAAWPLIAGAEVARHVQPVRLHGGVLVLRADAPEWATQVQYLGAQIVARAREELTDVAIRTVTVTVAGRRGGAGS